MKKIKYEFVCNKNLSRATLRKLLQLLRVRKPAR